TAQGDSSRFRQILTEYERAPQVTRDRLYLETMQQILGSTSKVIIDQKSGGNLLYLPLGELMKGAGGQAPLDVGSRTPPQPETIPAPVESRREGIRSRDREGGR